jgi:hypothetical protein
MTAAGRAWTRAVERSVDKASVLPFTLDRPMMRRSDGEDHDVPQHQDAAQLQTPASEEEIHASARHSVRKLSAFASPSKANQPPFERAIEKVAEATRELLGALVTNAPPHDRGIEAAKARARAAERYGPSARVELPDEQRE